MSKKTERVVLKSQAREIISKVYDFMKKEACNNYAEKLTDARWRTSQAAGVSESTVTRILREKRVHGMKLSTEHTNEAGGEQSNKAASSYPNEASTSTAVFTSPMKKRRVTPRKINLEEFDIGVLRRTIQDFHKENQSPTLQQLQSILRERIHFDGCKITLRTLLHRLGYKWRKTETNRKVLLEKHEIQMLRLNYIKQVKSLRSTGRPIIYTNESYINTDHVPMQNIFLSEQNSQIGKQKPVKGVRIIIFHAGSAAGFISNALLTYRAETKTGGYRDNMNTQDYLMWLKDKLIPNLPKDAVVVLNNAAYHNSALEKTPTPNSNKLEMQTWLSEKKIPFETSSTKLELYDLIKKNKENFRKYKVDNLLNNHGFTVLRLPPNHPELNPTENIWDIAKNYVISRNINQDYTYITPILEAFNNINSGVWASTCKHVEKIEDEYLKYFDLDFNFMTNVCDSSSSESNISEFNDDSE